MVEKSRTTVVVRAGLNEAWAATLVAGHQIPGPGVELCGQL